MIKAWRIVHQRNAESAFSGEGTRKRGSRWTSRGYRAIYVSESLSLATLEIIVHGVSYDTLKHFVYISASIPDPIITALRREDLPSSWREDPPPSELQHIGDIWIEKAESAVLKVPSAIIPFEFNYIINPAHPHFSQIQIDQPRKWILDHRLVGQTP